MQLIYWQQCDTEQQRELLQRPTFSSSAALSEKVREILVRVKMGGDRELKQFNQQFDHIELEELCIEQTAFDIAESKLSEALKQAICDAAKNIETFHQAQKIAAIQVETLPGVYCQQVIRAIPSVGLYIPGGSAPLFSTVLMLGIPAKIAGCQQIVLCSPPPIADEILFAAKLCGIDKVFQVGGAQAIGAMAFGTESIPKVAKIFGPGNTYVTEAKRQVSQVTDGAAIDMPAGPSEVLVIADSGANPAFIAADLLSQAEHGPDSQVILVTPDEQLAQRVAQQVTEQLATLPRAEIAEKALKESRLIVTESLEQCIKISNSYAPEHLIIQTRHPEVLVEQIINAGSVFLGDWSPESVGDYASGTNHVLPTYGYAKTCSSLGLADFQKRMTIQQLSAKGLLALASTVEIMAEAEQLIAHKKAVSLRVSTLKEQL